MRWHPVLTLNDLQEVLVPTLETHSRTFTRA